MRLKPDPYGVETGGFGRTKRENASRITPAPTKPTPARDSRAAVVTLLEPPKLPGPRKDVKFPGKVPPVKLNVRVKVVIVVPVPVTNLRDGLPIITRTSPATIRIMLASASLLTNEIQPQGFVGG